MAKDIYDIIMNPIRMRIIQAAAAKKSITAAEICEKLSDVPRTTLYRHISILVDTNVLTVIAEKKIRGSVERVLALNVDELSKHNTDDNVPQQAFRFLMSIYAKFEKYFGREGYTPQNNVIFFNNTIMMMDDGEFDSFLSELRALFIKYHYDTAEGRKPRNISIISAPPKSEDEYGEG